MKYFIYLIECHVTIKCEHANVSMNYWNINFFIQVNISRLRGSAYKKVWEKSLYPAQSHF